MMMIFCSACKIAFEDGEQVKVVKVKDGIEFYHVSCVNNNLPTIIIEYERAKMIPDGLLVFHDGYVKNVFGHRKKKGKYGDAHV